MAQRNESAICRAPAIEVWKLLHDPVRFSQWWAGIARAEPTGEGATLYPASGPDVGTPARVTSGRDGHRVMISCLVTDDLYTWTLENHPEGCRVTVCITVDGDDERLTSRHADILASLPRLVATAEGGPGHPGAAPG